MHFIILYMNMLVMNLTFPICLEMCLRWVRVSWSERGREKDRERRRSCIGDDCILCVYINIWHGPLSYRAYYEFIRSEIRYYMDSDMVTTITTTTKHEMAKKVRCKHAYLFTIIGKLGSAPHSTNNNNNNSKNNKIKLNNNKIWIRQNVQHSTAQHRLR